MRRELRKKVLGKVVLAQMKKSNWYSEHTRQKRLYIFFSLSFSSSFYFEAISIPCLQTQFTPFADPPPPLSFLSGNEWAVCGQHFWPSLTLSWSSLSFIDDKYAPLFSSLPLSFAFSPSPSFSIIPHFRWFPLPHHHFTQLYHSRHWSLIWTDGSTPAALNLPI